MPTRERRLAALAKATSTPPDTRAGRDLSPTAQRRRAETSRLRVQTSKLVDRLQQHAMGKIDMTVTQLTAAQALLRKTLPDLVGVKAEVNSSPVVFNFDMRGSPVAPVIPVIQLAEPEPKE